MAASTRTSFFQPERGERVYVRHTYGLVAPEWRCGIVTDTFISPVSGDRVVVVAGHGFYPSEVRPDDGERDAGTLKREHVIGRGVA